jgi:uncharacterized protein (DUF2267 family)
MPVSATGLDVFDRTLQATNVWLNQIMESVGPDRHVAWHVLGSVLRTLRDRLPLGLAAHLGAQLPLLVRGLYYDQWRPSDEPQKWRSLEEFLALVSVDLRDLRPVTPTDGARAVFSVLNHFIDPGQIEKVREALPEDVRRIWPESKPRAGQGRGSGV